MMRTLLVSLCAVLLVLPVRAGLMLWDGYNLDQYVCGRDLPTTVQADSAPIIEDGGYTRELFFVNAIVNHENISDIPPLAPDRPWAAARIRDVYITFHPAAADAITVHTSDAVIGTYPGIGHVSVAVFGSDIYAFGSESSTDIFRYTLSGNNTLSGPVVVGSLPHLVFGAAAAVNGTTLYIIGGGTASIGPSSRGSTYVTYHTGSFVYEFDVQSYALRGVSQFTSRDILGVSGLATLYAFFVDGSIVFSQEQYICDAAMYNVDTGKIGLFPHVSSEYAQSAGIYGVYLAQIPNGVLSTSFGLVLSSTSSHIIHGSKLYSLEWTGIKSVRYSIEIPGSGLFTFGDNTTVTSSLSMSMVTALLPLYTDLGPGDFLHDQSRSGHSVVYHNSCVIVTGGVYGGTRNAAIRNCGDIRNKTDWAYCTDGLLDDDFGRDGGSLVSLGGMLYVFGGSVASVPNPFVFRSPDGCATWQKLTPIDVPALNRRGAVTGCDGTRLYVLGGDSNATDPYDVPTASMFVSTDGEHWTPIVSYTAMTDGTLVPYRDEWVVYGLIGATNTIVRSCPGRIPGTDRYVVDSTSTSDGIDGGTDGGMDSGMEMMGRRLLQTSQDGLFPTSGTYIFTECVEPCPLHTWGAVLRPWTQNCTSCGGLYTYSNASVYSDSCQACPWLEYTPPGSLVAGNDSCVSCGVNWGGGGPDGTCHECDPGFTANPDNGQCLNCPTGYAMNSTNECEQCPAGTYSTIYGCAICSSGFVSIAGSDTCTLCTAGTYASHSNDTCLSCLSGWVSSAGSTQCTECPVDTYASPSGGDCTPCADGSHSVAGSIQCVQCLGGQYINPLNGSCMACEQGYVSALDFMSCVPCSGGTYANSSGCEPCAGGSVSVDMATSCTLCGVGTYATSPNGTCADCATGFVSASGSTECTPCMAGEYASGSTCEQCSPGSVSGDHAATCTACSPGTYENGLRTSCIQCPSGKTSPTGSTDVAQCQLSPPGVLQSLSVSTLTPVPIHHGLSYDQQTDTHIVLLPSYQLGFAQKVCLLRVNLDSSPDTSVLRINITVSGGDNVYIMPFSGNVSYGAYDATPSSYDFHLPAGDLSGPVAAGRRMYLEWSNREFGEVCFLLGFKEGRDHTSHTTDVSGLPAYSITFDLAYPSTGAGVLADIPHTVQWSALATSPSPYTMLDVVSAKTYLAGVGISSPVVGEHAGMSTERPVLYSVYRRQCLDGLPTGTHSYHEDTADPVLYVSGTYNTHPAGLPFSGPHAAHIASVVSLTVDSTAGFSNGTAGTVLSAVFVDPRLYNISVPVLGGSSCGLDATVVVRMSWFESVDVNTFRVAALLWTELGHSTTGTYGGSTLTSTFSAPYGHTALSSSISDPADVVDVETVSSGDLRLRLSNATVLPDGKVQFDVYVPFHDQSYTGPMVWYGVGVSDTCMHSSGGDYFSNRVIAGSCSNYNQTGPDWDAAEYPTESSNLRSWYWTQPRSDIPVPQAPVHVTVDGVSYVMYRYSATIESLLACKNDGSDAFSLQVVQGLSTISVYIPVSVSFLGVDNGVVGRTFCHTYKHRIDVPSTFKFGQAAQSIGAIGIGVVGVKLDHGTKALCKAATSSFFTPARDVSGNLPGQTNTVVDDVCDAQGDGQIARVAVTLRVAIPYTMQQGRRGILPPASLPKVDNVWQAAPRPSPGGSCYGFNATFHSSALSVRYIRNDAANLLNLFDVTFSTAYLPFKRVSPAQPALMTDLLSRCKIGSTGFSVDIPLFTTENGVEWADALQVYTPTMFSIAGVERFAFDVLLDVDPVTLSETAVLSPSFTPYRFVIPRLDTDAPVEATTFNPATVLATAEGDSIGFVVSDSRSETRNFANLYIREVTALARDQGGSIEAGWFGDECQLTPPVSGWASDVTPIVFVEQFRRVDRFPARSMPLDGARVSTALCRADQIGPSVLAGSTAFVCSSARCGGTAGLFNRTNVVTDELIPMRDGVVIPTIAVGRGKAVKFCVLTSVFACPSAVTGGRRLLALRTSRHLLSVDDLTASIGGESGVYGAFVDAADVDPPVLVDTPPPESKPDAGMGTGEIIGVVFGSIGGLAVVFLFGMVALSSMSRRMRPTGASRRVRRIPYDGL